MNPFRFLSNWRQKQEARRAQAIEQATTKQRQEAETKRQQELKLQSIDAFIAAANAADLPLMEELLGKGLFTASEMLHWCVGRYCHKAVPFLVAHQGNIHDPRLLLYAIDNFTMHLLERSDLVLQALLEAGALNTSEVQRDAMLQKALIIQLEKEQAGLCSPLEMLVKHGLKAPADLFEQLEKQEASLRTQIEVSNMIDPRVRTQEARERLENIQHAIHVLRNSVRKSAPTSDTPAQSMAEAAPSNKSVQSLPDPIDGNQLEAMETQLQAAISQLSEKSNLKTIITAQPWGWNPFEIREQPSPADARRLVLTKIASILGHRQKRTMDASFRMRFSDPDTSWDRDFGQPTSVLRVDFSLPDEKALDGGKRWNYGVTIGRSAPSQFLVWEWGQ